MKTKYLFLTLLATTALSIPAAHAATILTFGQIGSADTITGTNNGIGATTVTTNGAGVGVTITQIDAGISVPVNTTFVLSAHSIGPAITFLGQTAQRFSGTFSFTTGAINYLSGTFTDVIAGAGGGLTLTSTDNPTEYVTFTSNVIDNNLLTNDRSLSIGFANVTPTVHITNGSLGWFAAGVSGTFSSTVPEPSTWAMMLLGFVGLAYAGLRRQHKARLPI